MTRFGYPVVSGLLCVLLANGAGAAPTTQPADVEKENAALKERVAALEARVKTLERQLRDRTATIPFRVTPMPTPEARPFPDMPGIQIRPNQQAAPREGWEHREINGIRFYLVPLKADETR